MVNSATNVSATHVTKLGSISNLAAAEHAALAKVLASLPGQVGSAGPDAGISAAKLLVKGRAPLPPRRRPSAGGLESLIGDDERTRVLDSSNAPWRMICSLEIISPQTSLVGTGWFAGPKTLITAGHCVHDVALGGWASKIIVRPAQNGVEEPFGSLVATRFSTTDRWFQNRDPDFDYAAIHLEAADALPITDQTGWFSTAVVNDAGLHAQRVNVAGYPGDKGGDTLWFHAKQILHLRPPRIYYDIDTLPGQSGAPVWLETDSGPRVVGIHAYGVGASAPGVEANSGPRITEAVIERIADWLTQ